MSLIPVPTEGELADQRLNNKVMNPKDAITKVLINISTQEIHKGLGHSFISLY